MKTTTIRTEVIEATENSLLTTIVTLDSIPTVKEQKELFIDDSVVLEF
jgi:hypothetical protein